jgi:phosphatidylinositol alpha-1,6-mannosyltransferase
MSVPDRIRHAPKIVGLFTNLFGIGGVQEAGRLTAMALGEIASARGSLVEILSLNDPPGEHTVPNCDFRITFVGFGGNKTRFVLSAIYKALQTPRQRAPVILAAHPHLALLASWMHRANPDFQTIVMTHGIEVWTRLSPRRLHALQKARIVLAPSSYTAQKIADTQAIPASKIRRLPWPLNPRFLHLCANVSELPLRRDFPRGRIILTVGRWAAAEGYKGTDALILAVARLRPTNPDLHLVALGGGDDLPRLRKIVAERQLVDQVHFLENLSQEEVAACYANADVFALPSTGEGFGLVFLEAMAFAKPVVGVAAGGTPDLVQDGINGLLIPPDEPELLAESLHRLLQDGSLRKRLGEYGAAMVRREYQFNAFRTALEQLLFDVASNR